jgi:hypothetical protein
MRDRVLGRLLALNAERAAAEQLAGPGSSSKPASKRKKARAVNPSLLDESV